MAKVNKVDMRKDSEINKLADVAADQLVESTAPQKNNSLREVMKKDKDIRRNMFTMIVVWSSAGFCYYLISYQLKYL